MAKLNCICGAQLSNVMCPNQTEGLLLRDIDMEFDDRLSCCDISDIGRAVWECYACGRLAFNHPDKDGNRVKWYKPEDGEPGNLMKFDQPIAAVPAAGREGTK